MGDIAYQNKDITAKILAEALKGKSLAVLGLPGLRIADSLPTNLPVIESNELRLDHLFVLEDGSVAIMDYESEFDRENFVKYLNYIARVLRRYAKQGHLSKLRQLKMVVIYTADVKKDEAEAVYDLGGVLLRVEQAFLLNFDTERIVKELTDAIQLKEVLSEEELIELMLLPLTVKGKAEKQPMIEAAVNLAKNLPDRSQSLQALAGILTFSDKVIDRDYREQIKEEMRMTQIGQMLIEEGMEKGMEKGIEKGREAGQERVNRLNSILAKQNRAEDIIRAAGDRKWQETLFKEFGI